MSYMKQNKKRKQSLESAQYGLEITFKLNSILHLETSAYLMAVCDKKLWSCLQEKCVFIL